MGAAAQQLYPQHWSMEFNWLTLNGKVGPATTPLVVRQGNRVRIRMVNMGMDHHPIHLHGHTFVVTGSEAGRQPERPGSGKHGAGGSGAGSRYRVCRQ